jgi:ubiquinone biosynthesis O-methyltransferase
VDADTQAIEIAQAHGEGLDITYINGAAEDLQQQFDIVLALEIIEHVANPALFVQQVSKLVKPGGVVIFSTLNRTAKSFALGIVAAEYITRWVPRGTHDWKKFIKPSELAKMVRPADLTTEDITGLYYKPVEGEFVLSKDHLAVNYFMTAHKEA